MSSLSELKRLVYELQDELDAALAERDAAREETERWVQIARAALAVAQAQEPTDPVKTES